MWTWWVSHSSSAPVRRSETQEVVPAIDAFQSALPGEFVVLPQEARQLERLEVVVPQQLWRFGQSTVRCS
jgi:hypothetical protein